MITVVPAISRSSRLDRVELVAVVHRRRRARAAPIAVVLLGSSVTTTIRARAFGVELARHLAAPCSVPSTGWPPVIATASL